MYEVKDGIERAYAEHDDLLVVALTGRTGSGCTTAASILAEKFQDIAFVPSDSHEPERRKLKIIEGFASKKWEPFNVISVSAVIFSAIIQEPQIDFAKFIADTTGLSATLVATKVKPIYDELTKRAVDFAIFSSVMRQSHNASQPDKIATRTFYELTVKKCSDQFRTIFRGEYHKILQRVGDNIRISGKPFDSSVDPNSLFTLCRRIATLIDLYSDLDKTAGKNTRIVIDALRNPLELVYLRDRYAPLLTIAITADEDERHERLSRLKYSETQIFDLDEKEYPENTKHLDSYETFVSQNLQNCIQKADVYIHNQGKPGGARKQKTKALSSELVRYVCLALHPGLVTPTRDERCMQIAFVSKVNSGCISRQVGAAVADRHHSIKAVGWNDVPKGQVPCSLRDVGSLESGKDDSAFSTYELNNDKFREHVLEKNINRSALHTKGLPCPYCFKDAYNTRTLGKDEKNQIHTRSLHAEENAFLQLARYGNSAIDGGYLYTTASPCELCSKKAFQLGISEIVYVDPYPGISSSHVLGAGSNRPTLRLFSGAVGYAYHKLYEPMLSVKDEFRARMRVKD